MSQQLINQYLNEIDRLRKFSGSVTEGVISEAFKDLLKTWSRQLNWQFAAQYEFASAQKSRIRPDGTIFHSLGLPFGYWEAKDTADDLDVEIRKKLAKGYPQDNIIFENSQSAVLIQDRQEVFRCSMTDNDALLKLLNLFFGYERAEIREFRKAVEEFKTYLPFVLDALRARIETAYAHNPVFRTAAQKFLDHCRDTINPTLGEADVREMLIQHILTEEIFANVFNDGDFHHENNIAKELYALEGKFFTGAVKKETLKGLELYYAAIKANAAQITSHSEKQTFLKVIYENFYKVYDAKKADRLGVVYTPNEIVKFMIEAADWLCEKHFGKNLIDDHVEILDPATGTGTFVCELLEYFRGDAKKLAHKYKNELHANEVAILPYYVANLNIEATYAAISGQFAEFPNLCFVDTLDNTEGLGIKAGHQHDMFAGLSDENIERVRRQNKRKISVIIGNPPYNANQANENDNNKNRSYPRIDELIKSSYVRLSTAQKTKVYDMYARFFRWASDRMHDDGVLAFITNRSFIDSRTFDGFRKAVAEEFNEIYVVDLGGDVRANPKLSGTKHNVFGIQTGVAISFFVKRRRQKGCKIFYARRPEFETAADKLSFLGSSKLSSMGFERVEPDKRGNWINLTVNDWDQMIPIADKKTKTAKTTGQERAIFRQFSLGIVTNRDEWAYSETEEELLDKVGYFISVFEREKERWRRSDRKVKPGDLVSRDIKWTSELERHLERGTVIKLNRDNIYLSTYRPFVHRSTYFAPVFTHRPYQNFEFFPTKGAQNVGFSVSLEDRVEFAALASDAVPNKDLFLPNAAQFLPLYRFTPDRERVDNITDWGLKQFQKAYGKVGGPITKQDIFHYVYGVLHDPLYRENYAQNLKREFPRIPFYPDFRVWTAWGQQLMDLHIGYEALEPWPLTRLDTRDEKARGAGVVPKTILKADKDSCLIRLDTETTLSGIPNKAWDYKLGNRSGLEWILDQHREKTPKDPTIREKFNTYRFADYKEKVIDLIARVTRVSVETMEIVEAMKLAPRRAADDRTTDAAE
ncbi:DNA methyltransferase [Sinorhizobium medicae]|uniref:type ISP restriction/modification enzyme n=1 Tax=Sinorhizobium medicae TaxID=110321 RepID=UPI000C7BC6D9|nr:type ISP restriction/modification enzyme [Sinorhizobium medicae]PLT82567.1 DNA methyltransferase [Sinorhizobium medicae]